MIALVTYFMDNGYTPISAKDAIEDVKRQTPRKCLQTLDNSLSEADTFLIKVFRMSSSFCHPGTAIIHGDLTLRLKWHHNYKVCRHALLILS